MGSIRCANVSPFHTEGQPPRLHGFGLRKYGQMEQIVTTVPSAKGTATSVQIKHPNNMRRNHLQWDLINCEHAFNILVAAASRKLYSKQEKRGFIRCSTVSLRKRKNCSSFFIQRRHQPNKVTIDSLLKPFLIGQYLILIFIILLIFC